MRGVPVVAPAGHAVLRLYRDTVCPLPFRSVGGHVQFSRPCRFDCAKLKLVHRPGTATVSGTLVRYPLNRSFCRVQ